MKSLLFVLAASCASATIIWQDPITDRANWPDVADYSGDLKASFDGCFTICGTLEDAHDTAWHLRSKRITLTAPAPFFKFTAECTSSYGFKIPRGGSTWSSYINWYDKSGESIGISGFQTIGGNSNFGLLSLTEAIPANADSFEIQFGIDSPNLLKGDYVKLRNVKFETLEEAKELGFTHADFNAPLVKLVSTSPTTDASAPLSFRITDPSGINWDSIRVEVDGTDLTSEFKHDTPDTFTMAAPKTPWKPGLHRAIISASDTLGNNSPAERVFLIGEPPKTPKITQREDGAMLIDGNPFFPIGIYNVKKRAFNTWSFDRAFEDLKNAGFNFAHTYTDPRSPEFLDAALKYDIKLWVNAFEVDEWHVNVARHLPNVVAWYLGDDTADNTTVEKLMERDENVRAIDGTRITTQADPVASDAAVDRYESYAAYTDNFLPEIYPCAGADENVDRKCVAVTIRDMKRIALDNSKHGGNRKHSIWPIIQYFKGWGWKRFPTGDELYAMSFASLIHGANGITWYCYGSSEELGFEKTRFNYGVITSQETWGNITNTTRRISSLTPVLLERPVQQPAAPKILSGPARDACNNPSVTALYKSHAGDSYLLAVNATYEKVSAELHLPVSGTAEVLWESRTVPVESGAFKDEFAPLAVHVYRIKK